MVDPTATSPPHWPPGWQVQVVAETGSTNADLLAAAAAGAPDRSVLATHHQTAGRGRLDRRWEAPAGANLLVSLLFRTVPEVPVALTWRVGLAACAAAKRVAGVAPVLKWPNDLLLGDRKLAGILAQADFSGANAPAVVVGLGMNVGWAPEGAAMLGAGHDPLHVLSVLLEEFDRLSANIVPAYRARLGTLGQRVRVALPDDSVVEGRAIDVDADGRLVVLDDRAITHRFDVGDVVHLRPG